MSAHLNLSVDGISAGWHIHPYITGKEILNEILKY